MFCIIFLSTEISNILSDTFPIECNEIKNDDSYDKSVCTLSKLNLNENTECNFIKNEITVWWFIKKDLDFNWFKTIKVINSNLTVIPRVFLVQYRNMEILHIDGCSVEDWHPLTFVPGKNLRQIMLPRNRIKTIPRFAFYGSTVLEVIDLQNNHIESLHKYAFINLECLKELNLNGNLLQLLDLLVFNNVNLRLLNATHNQINQFSLEYEAHMKLKPKNELKIYLNDNKLKNFDIQEGFPVTELLLQNNNLTFIYPISNIKDLKILNVESNYLENASLTTFFDLKQLHYLNLRDTKLNSLNGVLFSRLTKLQHLDLSNNNFKKVDWNLLSAMSDLEEIVLLNNAISEADAESIALLFPNLKYIWISSSNWDCDDFQKFNDKLKSTGVKINTGKGKYGTKYDGSAVCVPTVEL